MPRRRRGEPRPIGPREARVWDLAQAALSSAHGVPTIAAAAAAVTVATAGKALFARDDILQANLAVRLRALREGRMLTPEEGRGDKNEEAQRWWQGAIGGEDGNPWTFWK